MNRDNKDKKMKNKKKVSLLQLYITSLLSLVMSVTMLFGTTMAWFTSEVTSASNEICAGTLSVDILHEGVSLKEDTKHNVFDSIWEPDYTVVETLQVQNKGDLGLNYQIFLITDSNLAENSMADYFSVYVYEGVWTSTEELSFDQNIAGNSAWTRIGGNNATLKDVLNNNVPLYGGVLETEETSANKDFTIALHMDANAPESVMGQNLSVKIKLVAYQKAYGIPVASQEELDDAISNGGEVVQVSLGEGTYVLPKVADKDITIIGAGEETIVDHSVTKALSNSNITIKNATIQGVNNDYIGFHHAASETYINCTIENQLFVYGTDTTFINCTFDQNDNAYNVWTYGASNIKFTGCTFNSAGKALLLYNEGAVTKQVAVIENCTFNASVEGYTGDNQHCAAIEIDSSYTEYDVAINGCTAAENFSGLVRHKKGDKAVTITVDGVVQQ